ncbi:hypothetical protein B0T26DRAFT_450764 [Lasiosphaeria miniovina]|uniref:Uncharacterized protein n=1 Tax=Lasiosphaeria miniovina TaxID=1954250 RepID=A0AA39ZZ85_9PEZI|nr:uncharacterized protein B0T26DRAFT_450764 [Lasiosphaeria miniovina]KAK0706382.1 hypothetical protein B0T26DRAFT_450764 [Lasiosphaeria miniovina]
MLSFPRYSYSWARVSVPSAVIFLASFLFAMPGWLAACLPFYLPVGTHLPERMIATFPSFPLAFAVAAAATAA